MRSLYARARAGEIANVTGIDAPYEAPPNADLVLNTDEETLEANVQKVIDFLAERGFLSR